MSRRKEKHPISDAEYERFRHGWRCPDCNAPMVERTNRYTRKLFFGCSTFPKCTGTRETDGHVADTWESTGADRRDGYNPDEWEAAQDYGYDGDG